MPASRAGLFDSLRRLLRTSLEIAEVRLELLVADLEFEKLRFVEAALRALLGLMLIGLGMVLVAAGIDPLTAYLATSPGGVDSVAIIAASAGADLPFIMAMQTARFLVVLFVGPRIARFVANRVRADPG